MHSVTAAVVLAGLAGLLPFEAAAPGPEIGKPAPYGCTVKYKQ